MRVAITLILMLALVSCSEKQQGPPKNVLDKEQMSELLVDFTLAESAATVNPKKSPLEKYDSTYAFNPLKDRKIERALYDTSLYYYSRHPEEFKEVYDLTLEKLSKMQASRTATNAH